MEKNEKVVEMQNQNEEKVEQTNEKTNVFKKIGHGIASGFRAVKENPAAAAIGAIVGGLAVEGGRLIVGHLLNKTPSESEETEPIEIELPDTTSVEETLTE